MKILDLFREPQAVELQQEIVSASNELGAVLEGCKVAMAFRPHVTDNETGLDGLRNAMLRVMREHADTGLTAEEICYLVRKSDRNFAVNSRYPQHSYEVNLSSVLIPSGEVVAKERHVEYVIQDGKKTKVDPDPERNSPKTLAMRQELRTWAKLHGCKVYGLKVRKPRTLYFPVPQT